jgi:hypothetical protein
MRDRRKPVETSSRSPARSLGVIAMVGARRVELLELVPADLGAIEGVGVSGQTPKEGLGGDERSDVVCASQPLQHPVDGGSVRWRAYLGHFSHRGRQSRRDTHRLRRKPVEPGVADALVATALLRPRRGARSRDELLRDPLFRRRVAHAHRVPSAVAMFNTSGAGRTSGRARRAAPWTATCLRGRVWQLPPD